MNYYMVCWEEDFESFFHNEYHYSGESDEETSNRFRLMIGEEKETVIREFLVYQYSELYEDGCDYYFDPLLMHEFILHAIYGDTQLKGAVNESAINELSSKIYDRYWELLKENDDSNYYYDEAGEKQYGYSGDDEKYADLLGKEFPSDRLLSLLSDAEKKDFFVSEMYYRVVAIKILVANLFKLY